MESETISTSDDSTKDLRILILMKFLIETALMAVPKKVDQDVKLDII
jgi:hypothetical protein